MLKRRLIPKLQMRRTTVGTLDRMVLVTTIRFGEALEIGDPVSQAKIFQDQAADELIFLDLDASAENRENLVDVVRTAAEQVFMPFTVGGGVRSLDDFRSLLSNGADKIAVNTAALQRPDLIDEAAERFGNQCVVLSVDARRNADGSCTAWTHGGKNDSGRDVLDWCLEGERRGSGEILLTSVDRDGTREGLDIELTRMVTDNVSVPVITSGGCGLAEHFVAGFLEGGACAVSAGTYFCFKDENPMQTRSQIRNARIPIRLHT